MTGQEIIDKLNELESKSDFWYEELEDEVFGEHNYIDSVGGHEGAGEYAHRVVHFIDHDVYIKLEGYYSSYNGTEYDDSDYEEVRPVQKTVTFFE